MTDASSRENGGAAPIAEFRPTHRHVKRGSLYEHIGGAVLQTDRPLTDNALVTVYRDEVGNLWVRCACEFLDGRFEALPAPPSASRPMTGFMATLSPEQCEAALAYRGDDHIADAGNMVPLDTPCFECGGTEYADRVCLGCNVVADPEDLKKVQHDAWHDGWAQGQRRAPERDVVAKIRTIIGLWFMPWGAAKGVMWEDLSGDRPFDANVALDLIRDALASQLSAEPSDAGPTLTKAEAEAVGRLLTGAENAVRVIDDLLKRFNASLAGEAHVQIHCELRDAIEDARLFAAIHPSQERGG